jgi:CheY-like chemotaxis protein
MSCAIRTRITIVDDNEDAAQALAAVLRAAGDHVTVENDPLVALANADAISAGFDALAVKPVDPRQLSALLLDQRSCAPFQAARRAGWRFAARATCVPPFAALNGCTFP